MAHTQKHFFSLKEVSDIVYKMQDDPQHFRASQFIYGMRDKSFPKPRHIAFRFLRTKGWLVHESKSLLFTSGICLDTEEQVKLIHEYLLCIQCKPMPFALRFKITLTMISYQFFSFLRK